MAGIEDIKFVGADVTDLCLDFVCRMALPSDCPSSSLSIRQILSSELWTLSANILSLHVAGEQIRAMESSPASFIGASKGGLRIVVQFMSAPMLGAREHLEGRS
mgnify:FL=1